MIRSHMTIADLRDVISELPDTMPIAIPGYELGYDPATVPFVRTLAPKRRIYSWEGVLTEDDTRAIRPRDFLIFDAAVRDADVNVRLGMVFASATYDDSEGRWYTVGWNDDAQIPLPFDEDAP